MLSRGVFRVPVSLGVRPGLARSIGTHARPFKTLEGAVDTSSKTFQENLKTSEKLEEKYTALLQQVLAGGGPKAIDRHVKKNKKLLVRDRLRLLLDEGCEFLELSPLAGMGMEYGDIPAAGMVTGIGVVSGVRCLVTGHDATVKGGTSYPIQVKKGLRVQEIAQENHLPCIYLVDSGGAFLPLQSDIFPDKNHGGRMFYNEAILSSLGIPQVSVVVGSCTAGGAYIPTMTDEAVIVRRMGTIFLGGPPLVQAALGEVVSAEELGGAMMHSSVSGCTDHYAETELEAFEMARDIVAGLNRPMAEYLHSHDGVPMEDSLRPLSEQHHNYEHPLYPTEELQGLLPGTENFDIYKVIARLTDGSRFHEFKHKYGTSLVTGFAFIQGHLAGIVANNGPLCERGALKGAHFTQLCAQRAVPMIFLQNTSCDQPTANNVTEAASLSNRLKAHGKMASAVASSLVPKITLILGNGVGPETIPMCGRSFSPRFLFVWPNAKVGVADVQEAVQAAVQAKFGDAEGEEREKFQSKMAARLSQQTSAFYSSSRVWDDGIVLPQDSRRILGQCLRIVHSTLDTTDATERRKFGVFRM
ncbi:biotin-dependent 3-methylcrotonyl-coenzyme A carboxylase beta1 subunit-like isoform X2 [Branchiostoma floridae x Branchiostoma belcheri]